MTVFDNKLWIAYVANNASNELLVTSSTDGTNWAGSTLVGGSTTLSPALAGISEAKYAGLRLAYVATAENNALRYSSSGDGANWSSSASLIDGLAAISPCLVGIDGTLID